MPESSDNRRPPISRRFPDIGWAWPRGSHDLLIKAVLAPQQAALDAARAWLDANDIDEASFRDHRLLAALCQRHGRGISGHPAYPRLVGLQRHLWARSQMAAREARPVLAEIAARNVAIMLLKGASRVALSADAQKGRVARDVDVLVHPGDAAAAVAVLEAHGWEPSDGTSVKFLRTRLNTLRSINFTGARFGDIDLHTRAYHPSQDHVGDEARLWRDAGAHRYEGVPVLAPSAADRAALAIAHGALDAHTHSDWLTDCAFALSSPDMDWRTFADIVTTRGLEVPGTIALCYMAQELGTPVPADLLAMLNTAYRTRPFGRIPALVQAKPRMNMGPGLHALRWLAKEHRKRALPAAHSTMPEIRGRRRRARPGTSPATGFALVHGLPYSARTDGAEQVKLALTVRVAAPGAARRVEFEINGATRHVARLRYRKLTRRAGVIDIAFHGGITLDPADAPFVIEARPLRSLRSNHGLADAIPYGALAFQVVSVEIAAERS